MARKKTHEEFLEEVKEAHGDSVIVISPYINSNTKVKVKHNIPSCDYEWDVKPYSLKRGIGCPNCAGNIKWSEDTLRDKIYQTVGQEYSYVKGFINTEHPLTIRHNSSVCENYEWDVRIRHFLKGSRCPKCYEINNKKTTEDIKKEIRDISNGEYKLIGKYTNKRTKIKLKHVGGCGKEYEVLVANFKKGCRCPYCNEGNGLKKDTCIFKKEVYDTVGEEYEVLGEYENALTKIKMKHVKCGYVWDALPTNFINNRRGCPKCCNSIGEERIYQFLSSRVYDFSIQHRIKKCRNILPLPFDFAVFNKNKSLMCLIEYDGRQHFEINKFFGGEKGFRQRQHNDQIKNQYCKDNNIPLIRIPYWEFDNIEDILNEELKDLISNSEHRTQQAS